MQDCGEVVEGLLRSIARQSASTTSIAPGKIKGSAAVLVDEMYMLSVFNNYRAALGGVRSFLQVHRNPVSHPPTDQKAAVHRVKHLREGFISGLRQIPLLAETATNMGLKVIVYG